MDSLLNGKTVSRIVQSQFQTVIHVRVSASVPYQYSIVRYSAIVDKEIKHQMSEGSTDDKLIQEFALMTLSSFKYQAVNSDTSLILSLNHSESAMRVHGVKHLAKMLDNEVNFSMLIVYTCQPTVNRSYVFGNYKS